MAPPTSLPSPRRRLVPNSMITISRMITSCQILMPIISIYSVINMIRPPWPGGCWCRSVHLAMHHGVVHVVLIPHICHITVLRRRGLLQERLVDLAEGQHQPVVFAGQGLGRGLVGKGSEGSPH